jgi:hypothetical protein
LLDADAGECKFYHLRQMEQIDVHPRRLTARGLANIITKHTEENRCKGPGEPRVKTKVELIDMFAWVEAVHVDVDTGAVTIEKHFGKKLNKLLLARHTDVFPVIRAQGEDTTDTGGGQHSLVTYPKTLLEYSYTSDKDEALFKTKNLNTGTCTIEIMLPSPWSLHELELDTQDFGANTVTLIEIQLGASPDDPHIRSLGVREIEQKNKGDDDSGYKVMKNMQILVSEDEAESWDRFVRLKIRGARNGSVAHLSRLEVYGRVANATKQEPRTTVQQVMHVDELRRDYQKGDKVMCQVSGTGSSARAKKSTKAATVQADTATDGSVAVRIDGGSEDAAAAAAGGSELVRSKRESLSRRSKTEWRCISHGAIDHVDIAKIGLRPAVSVSAGAHVEIHFGATRPTKDASTTTVSAISGPD